MAQLNMTANLKWLVDESVHGFVWVGRYLHKNQQARLPWNAEVIQDHIRRPLDTPNSEE